jgi:hypothetical protein
VFTQRPKGAQAGGDEGEQIFLEAIAAAAPAAVLAHHALGRVSDQRRQDRLLGREVIEQRAGGDPRGVGDIARRGWGEATLGEELPRGFQDPLAGFDLGLGSDTHRWLLTRVECERAHIIVMRIARQG